MSSAKVENLEVLLR